MLAVRTLDEYDKPRAGCGVRNCLLQRLVSVDASGGQVGVGITQGLKFETGVPLGKSTAHDRQNVGEVNGIRARCDGEFLGVFSL